MPGAPQDAPSSSSEQWTCQHCSCHNFPWLSLCTACRRSREHEPPVECPAHAPDPVIHSLTRDDVDPTLVCPVSDQVLSDPVVLLRNGRTYERAACPDTSGEAAVVTNHVVRRQLEQIAKGESLCMAEGAECPILHETMEDPVVCADGHTYERRAIENWFRTSIEGNRPTTSPLTRAVLRSHDIVPNMLLRQQLERAGRDLAALPADWLAKADGSGASPASSFMQQVRRPSPLALIWWWQLARDLEPAQRELEAFHDLLPRLQSGR